MDLFYWIIGQGKPLVILHGLYGLSDNWLTIAKKLESNYTLIILDQRNHGQSPHSPDHTYQHMVNDLFEITNKLKLNSFYLLGHSMGGRVAMLFQSQFPMKVEKLVVVDVAPWNYSSEDEWFRSAYAEHMRIIEALKALKPEEIASRIDADRVLQQNNLDERLRNFLLKNLKRKSGGFEWQINLNALENNLEHILFGVEVNSSSASVADVLFIRGENSNYIPTYQVDRLKEVYPKCQVVSIPDAGHWVHAEKPQMFVSAVMSFLG